VIPQLIDIKAPWCVLPSGIHKATLQEVKQTFATSGKRRALFKGLKKAVKNLRQAGCTEIYLDGSFVTSKFKPGDYDVCWAGAKINTNLLDPVFSDFSNQRNQQKKKYGGEFFPAWSSAGGHLCFLDYFQRDRYTSRRKGIILIT
jgi:predicted nucleotidyltransferase